MSEPAMQHEGNHVASRDPGERETLMVLEIEELCVRRTGDGRLLLSDVSFQLAAGQYGIVTGRSGVGKSLLFQAILGLLPEDVFEVTGTVRFGDHLILGPDGYDSKLLEQCLGGSIAAIFQEPTSHLHPSLPVGWQLRETWDANSWRLTEHDLQVVRDRLAAVVLTDNESAPLHSRYAFQLSQGQQQRAMFAMATGDAELVLADEPTSSLDENTEHEIVDLVRGLRDAGSFVSMLAITHNLDAFRPFLEDQDLVIEIALVDGVGRAIASHPVSAVPRIEWVGDDTAKETHSSAEAATLLTVEGLSVDIGGRWNRRSRRLLSEVSFEVEDGEYFSVGGPSGCGKTTLAKTLLGLIAPSEGRILFRASPGGEVEELLPARVPEMRRQIQMIFQDALGTFDPKTTVGETLREILHYSGMREHERQDDRMSPLLESLGLVVPGSDPEPILARFPAEFSGGQRQRLGVVRALLLKPRLLIADEPFASQDIETALEMVDLFREMGERFGIAMILISHDRRLVRRLCRRGIELRDGVVVGGEES